MHAARRGLGLSLRLGVLAAVATVASGLAATPAMAIPTLPPETPSNLIILTYIDGDAHVVGQTWFGCPGVPLDTWGVTTGEARLSTQPCQDNLPGKPKPPRF